MIWLQLRPVKPIDGHVENDGAEYDEKRGGARPVWFFLPIHDFARPTSEADGEVQKQISGKGSLFESF